MTLRVWLRRQRRAIVDFRQTPTYTALGILCWVCCLGDLAGFTFFRTGGCSGVRCDPMPSPTIYFSYAFCFSADAASGAFAWRTGDSVMRHGRWVRQGLSLSVWILFSLFDF